MVELINIKPDVVLDLGKKACGELAINIMKKMKIVEGGQVLEVHALDPGAANDIPAWCRMTKNELLAGPCGEDNAFYYIKKKLANGCHRVGSARGENNSISSRYIKFFSGELCYVKTDDKHPPFQGQH